MASGIARALDEGAALFNRGLFFEAHEVWEDLWRPAGSEERLLLHGLIQVAAGLHKLQCGESSGAASLLAKGSDKLASCGAAAERCGLGSFLAALGALRETARRAAGTGRPASLASPRPAILPETRRGRFRARLLTHVEIGASAARVWETLARFDAYPGWNPFIPEIRGEARRGARLAVTIRPPGGRRTTFRPRVLKVDPERELRWRGRLFVPGLFDGEHVFGIASLGPGRVRFSQRETFQGLLVPVLGASLLGATRRGFEEMNQALKRIAEGA